MFGFKKLKRYLRDPYFALGCDLIQKHPNWMSDKFFTENVLFESFLTAIANPYSNWYW